MNERNTALSFVFPEAFGVIRRPFMSYVKRSGEFGFSVKDKVLSNYDDVFEWLKTGMLIQALLG